MICQKFLINFQDVFFFQDTLYSLTQKSRQVFTLRYLYWFNIIGYIELAMKIEIHIQ